VSTDCYLYLQETPANSSITCIGRLVLHDMTFDQARTCLQIDVEFFQEDNPRLVAEQAPRWIELRASIFTNEGSRREVGTIDVPSFERPAFRPTPVNSRTRVSWNWRLTQGDVENIERLRAHAPTAPLYLQIEVNGIVQIPEGVFGVNVSSGAQLKVESSQWETLITALGYTVGPSGLVAISAAGQNAPSWRESGDRLETARKLLRDGEDYAALQACLGEFEKIVSGPYSSANWKSLLAHMPAQKSDSVAAWLGGLCTYLNRVGHHKDRTDRDASGDLPSIPLDHWEAELAVSSAHFLLAYVVRLRSSSSVTQPGSDSEPT
jgi:hypothetical protein